MPNKQQPQEGAPVTDTGHGKEATYKKDNQTMLISTDTPKTDDNKYNLSLKSTFENEKAKTTTTESMIVTDEGLQWISASETKKKRGGNSAMSGTGYIQSDRVTNAVKDAVDRAFNDGIFSEAEFNQFRELGKLAQQVATENGDLNKIVTMAGTIASDQKIKSRG